MWLGITVAAIAILFGSRFYLLAKYRWVGSDSFYLLISGHFIRANRNLNFVNDRFVIPEQFDYPPLVPWLISKVPTRRIRHLQWMGPICDVLCATVVGAFAYSIAGGQAGVITLLVYATTPGAFNISYMLSARSIGNLFLVTTLLSLLLVYGEQWQFGWVVAGLTGGLVLLSHRLTLQSLLACFLGIVLFDPLTALGAAGIAVSVAILLSRGWYIKSFKGHVNFLRDLYRNGGLHVSPLRGLIALLVQNPHVFVVIALLLQSGTPLKPIDRWLLVCIVMLLLLSIAWPLGEGERHFDNASGLLAITVGLLTVDAHDYIPVAATSIIAGSIVASKLIRFPKKAETQGVSTIVTGSVLEACEFLRRSPRNNGGNLVVLSWPLSLSYQIMYLAHARIVAASGGTGEGLLYNYELIKRIEKSGLETLTGREVPTHVLHHQATSLQIDRTEWQEIFSSGEVKVYKNRAICGSR